VGTSGGSFHSLRHIKETVMRKEILTSLCALGLLVGASAAYAGTYGDEPQNEESPAAPYSRPEPVPVDDGPDYARTGFYLGLGGNFAIEFFDGSMNVDNSSGYHVRAGYRVHPNVALEARYERYMGFETDPNPGHFEGWSATGNVKGFILTGRYQPYLLFGMGYFDLNYPGRNRAGDASPGDDFAMRFGAGLEGNITEHIAIGPEIAYVLPVGDASDLDMLTISLGLQYKF
jgi:opacity protein-like surface antigen